MSPERAKRSGKRTVQDQATSHILHSILETRRKASEVDHELLDYIRETRRDRKHHDKHGKKKAKARPLDDPVDVLQVAAELRRNAIIDEIERTFADGIPSATTTRALANIVAAELAKTYNHKEDPDFFVKAWADMPLYRPPSLAELVLENGDDPAKLPELLKRFSNGSAESEREAGMKVRYYVKNFRLRLDQLTEELMTPLLFEHIIPRLEYFTDIGATDAEVRQHAARLLLPESNEQYIKKAYALLGMRRPAKLSFSTNSRTIARILHKKYDGQGQDHASVRT